MIQWYNEMSHHVIESKTSHVYNITVYTCASNFINKYDTNIYKQHHTACSHCSQRLRNISTINLTIGRHTHRVPAQQPLKVRAWQKSTTLLGCISSKLLSSTRDCLAEPFLDWTEKQKTWRYPYIYIYPFFTSIRKAAQRPLQKWKLQPSSGNICELWQKYATLSW